MKRDREQNIEPGREYEDTIHSESIRYPFVEVQCSRLRRGARVARARARPLNSASDCVISGGGLCARCLIIRITAPSPSPSLRNNKAESPRREQPHLAMTSDDRWPNNDIVIIRSRVQFVREAKLDEEPD